MTDKKYLIYKTTNTVNNKIYIGKHQTSDLNDGYLGSGKVLKRAFKKYGIDKFKREILFECESLDEVNKLEAEIVNEEFIARLDTYNIKLGGQGGWDFINTNCHNNKHNHRQTGFIQSLIKGVNPGLETRLNYNDEEYNEFCQKVSNGLKLYYQYNDNGFKNKKHNFESKRKIGNANSKHQKGKGNSQYGTCWITNGIENKKVKKGSNIPKNWRKGRKIKN